jgi:uncharacterized membrane protein YoaK (UPF0700 family)
VPRITNERLTPLRSGWLLPFALSTAAGAVDVTSFLALGGLFTAHLTGNLVILAAHYITGHFCEIGPMLSVPLFVAVLSAVTWVSRALHNAGHAPRRELLLLHFVLLATALGLGAGFGPFADHDKLVPVVVGALAVAAMATQSALVKLTLPNVPSTIVMTTNVTVLTIDVASLAGGWGEPDELARARRRTALTFPCVVGFASGCAAGAVLEVNWGLWALVLPVALATVAVALGELRQDGPSD